jgi:MFS family permease
MSSLAENLASENMTPSEIKQNLFGVIISVSVAGAGFGLSFPLLSLIMESNGVDEVTMGLNAAMFALASLTFAPFVPRIMAKIGMVNSLYLSFGTVIVCLISFKATPSMPIWFVMRYFAGAAIAGLFIITEIWILSLATDKNRAKLIALYSMSMAGGFALGPAILLATGPGGWTPFLAGSVIILLAALPLARIKHLVPKFEYHPSDAPLLSLLRIAPLPLIAGFAFGAIENSQFNFITVYGLRTAFNETNVAQLLLVIALGDVFCQAVIGWFADRHDKRKILAILGFLGILGAGLVPFVIYNNWLLFPTVFLWGGVTMGLYTMSLANLGDRFQGSKLAGANALLVMTYGAGSLIGPPIAGAAMDRWDPHGFLYSLAVIAALFTLFAVYRVIRHPSADIR